MNPLGRSALCRSPSAPPRRFPVSDRRRWAAFFACALLLAGCSAGGGDGHESFFDDAGEGGKASTGEAGGRRDGGFDANTMGTPDATTGLDASPSTDTESPIDSTVPVAADSSLPGADAGADSGDAGLGPDDSSVVTDAPALDSGPALGDGAVTPDVAVSDAALGHRSDRRQRSDRGQRSDHGRERARRFGGLHRRGCSLSPGGLRGREPVPDMSADPEHQHLDAGPRRHDVRRRLHLCGG